MTETLVFKIISEDAGISARWQSAFRKEGWPVEVVSSFLSEDWRGHAGAELHLVEAGAACCRSPKDLQVLQKTRHPVSTLVFGDPKKISNSQIAAFLEAGADDFVYTTLDERVLVAKLKAHIRRLMPVIIETSARCASSDGGIEIDNNRRAVKINAKPGECMELNNLTQKELDILTFLVGHERQVVSREIILEKLWGKNAINVYSECVDKHVESLRKKLGTYGKKIRTVYGCGYMFTEKKQGA